MPPGNLRVVYRQLPTHTYAGWNNLGDVHNTLRELEFGRFRLAAIMLDQMFRDDRFYGTMRTRIDRLESVELDVKPADDRALARKIAEDLGGDDDTPGQWDRQFPAPVIAELNKWGIGLNFGVAEIIWDTTDPKRWRPWLKPWHPQWVRWDWGTFSYKIMTADGEVELPRLDENPRGDGKWFVWCPLGYHQAWMSGLVRSVAVSVLERGLVRRDWGRYNEKHGLAIDKLTVPASADEAEKDAVFASVAGRNGETAVMFEDQGEAGLQKGSWDLELVEAKSKTWDTYQASRKEINADIAIAVLGQNLTTEMGGAGASGSKAGGQVHEAVARDRLRKDAGIAVPIRDQVLSHDAEFNFDDETLAPRPIYQVDPPEDLASKATSLGLVATALMSFKTAGTPVAVREILEDAEIPAMTEEEEAAAKAVAAEEAAAAMEQQRQAAAAAGGGAGGPPAKPAPDPVDGDEKKVAEGTTKASARPFGGKGVAKRYTFAGLPIAVENPKGTLRTWTEDGPNGRSIGNTKMQYDYGFIDGHVGNDDEELDCYVGPDESAANVHIVHQMRAPDFKKYDEDKIMLGFASPDAATAAFAAHRNDGTKAIGGMSTIPLDEFKRKIKRRTGTGKIRAGSAVTIQAIGKLAARASSAMKLAQKTGKPKDLKWADGLMRASTMLGARALAVDLAKVKHVLDGAKDWKDLEHRLVKAYAEMDPSDFASAVQKTRMMSNLGGQLSAVKQT